jgi:Flp pilus assembly protein TadB
MGMNKTDWFDFLWVTYNIVWFVVHLVAGHWVWMGFWFVLVCVSIFFWILHRKQRSKRDKLEAEIAEGRRQYAEKIQDVTQ